MESIPEYFDALRFLSEQGYAGKILGTIEVTKGEMGMSLLLSSHEDFIALEKYFSAVQLPLMKGNPWEEKKIITSFFKKFFGVQLVSLSKAREENIPAESLRAYGDVRIKNKILLAHVSPKVLTYQRALNGELYAEVFEAWKEVLLTFLQAGVYKEAKQSSTQVFNAYAALLERYYLAMDLYEREEKLKGKKMSKSFEIDKKNWRLAATEFKHKEEDFLRETSALEATVFQFLRESNSPGIEMLKILPVELWKKINYNKK